LLSLTDGTAPGEPVNATVGSDDADQPDADQVDARVMAVRCRLDQDYLGEPADLARPADQAAGAARGGQAPVLWGRFLDLHEPAGRPFAERFTKSEADCDRLAAGTSPTVAALAADLRARAETLRFLVSGRGPGSWPVAAAWSRGPPAAQLPTAAAG